MDGAWHVVREGSKALSKQQIARMTGVSPRSVATMRQLLATLKAAPDAPQATGSWWADKNILDDGTSWVREEMTDMQRQAAIRDMANAFSQAAGRTPKRDIQMLADALHEAMGDRVLKDVMDYLFTPAVNGGVKTIHAAAQKSTS